MKRIADIKNTVSVIVISMALSSCGFNELTTFKAVTASISAASQGFFSRADVNLKAKNYAVADFLAGQIGDIIKHPHELVAEPFQEVDHAGISSPFGRAVPEGVGLRLIELGYKVQLHQVAANGNEGLYPKPKSGHEARFSLRGTYAVKSDTVDVFVRVIDQRSNQVVGTFDYTLPLSDEIRELAKTETRIFLIKDK